MVLVVMGICAKTFKGTVIIAIVFINELPIMIDFPAIEIGFPPMGISRRKVFQFPSNGKLHSNFLDHTRNRRTKTRFQFPSNGKLHSNSPMVPDEYGGHDGFQFPSNGKLHSNSPMVPDEYGGHDGFQFPSNGKLHSN